MLIEKQVNCPVENFQRTALIKTLLREEPILLLDEPFSALEPDMIYKASELIEKHTQKLQSITLIISHQDLNSYLPISQRLELG